MREPEPSPDLAKDVLEHLAIPLLRENDVLVVSELIAIIVVCHTHFPTRAILTQRSSKIVCFPWI